MMRTPTENKMTTTATEQCPRCGRGASPYGCRDVRDGWFCRQWGLTYDSARLLAPEVDPVTQAVSEDPQVQATAMLEREAQQRFDEASAAWEKAAGELAAIRRKARSDLGEFNASGGWRPSAAVRKLAARERVLAPEVQRLWRRREEAGDEVVDARQQHARAADDARLRAGGSVWYRPATPVTNLLTIPYT